MFCMLYAFAVSAYALIAAPKWFVKRQADVARKNDESNLRSEQDGRSSDQYIFCGKNSWCRNLQFLYAGAFSKT